jgi:hypothetical protein
VGPADCADQHCQIRDTDLDDLRQDCLCIVRRAHARTNLPTRARWYPPIGGGCGRTWQRNGSQRLHAGVRLISLEGRSIRARERINRIWAEYGGGNCHATVPQLSQAELRGR